MRTDKPSHPWIFISYRRAGNGHLLADRIASELEIKCGRDSIFVDRKGIEAGTEWNTAILGALARCAATVVVIGRDWPLDQLHDAHDWVRLEISESLRSRKYLLPLFIDGGVMPTRESLPTEIRTFAERQGVFIDSRSNEVFAAALSVVGDYVRTNCPSTMIFEREPQARWATLWQNTWVLRCDGAELVTLKDAETVKEAEVPSGVHTFSAKWTESGRTRLSTPRYEADYPSSYGDTETITVSLAPGRHRVTLRVDQEALGNRTWGSKFRDFFFKEYDSRRKLVLVS